MPKFTYLRSEDFRNCIKHFDEGFDRYLEEGDESVFGRMLMTRFTFLEPLRLALYSIGMTSFLSGLRKYDDGQENQEELEQQLRFWRDVIIFCCDTRNKELHDSILADSSQLVPMMGICTLDISAVKEDTESEVQVDLLEMVRSMVAILYGLR